MFVHALRQSPFAIQSLVVTAGLSLTAILGNTESSQGKSRLTGLAAMVEGAPLVMEMLCMSSHSVHTRRIKMCTKRRCACGQFILRDVFEELAGPLVCYSQHGNSADDSYEFSLQFQCTAASSLLCIYDTTSPLAPCVQDCLRDVCQCCQK